MQNFQPHKYQQDAIRLLITHGAAGLLLDPGLGKTSITLAASKILLDKKLVKGVLVIAPLRPAKNTWPEERLKWSQFNDLDMVILHGKDKDRLLEGKHDIYVINPEGLEWLLQPVWNKKSASLKAARMQYLTKRFDMLVIDESTKFKSPSSQRFRMIKASLNWWKRRYILTGTPAPNGVQDLWSQIYILDGGASLTPYITQFRNKYFYLQPNSHEYDLRLLPGAVEDIAEKINHLVLRMKAMDYLQLPELVYNRIEVDLPPEARKHYDTFEQEFIIMLEQNIITAANAAVMSNKLRQLVAGAMYHDGQAVPVHTAKADALADLVEELAGQPVLVGYDFVFEKEMIKKAVPHAKFLDGAHDKELIQLFNAGMIPVLVGNPASVGHGLNLQTACCHVAYLSLTWNLENFEQFIKRVLRQGNDKLRVVCHLIVGKNTVDEAVWRTLQDKNNTQITLLSHVRTCIMGSSGATVPTNTEFLPNQGELP
jgi:SNF2 family DNA or RNA helicase